MILAVIVIAVLLVAVIGWAVVTYNGLIRLRNLVQEAWRQIDVELTRRHDLIGNLVETVKGYAAHERGTLEDVVRARSAAMAPGQSPAAQAESENMLSQALGRLLAIVEAYPDLKANQNFMALQNELTATEDRIASARRYYNATVRDLNTKVETVPSNIIAGVFNIDRAEYFEAVGEQREAPRVDFGQRDAVIPPPASYAAGSAPAAPVPAASGGSGPPPASAPPASRPERPAPLAARLTRARLTRRPLESGRYSALGAGPPEWRRCNSTPRGNDLSREQRPEPGATTGAGAGVHRSVDARSTARASRRHPRRGAGWGHARRDHHQGTDQDLRGAGGRRRPRPRHRHRRVLRPPRPERRRQDHDHGEIAEGFRPRDAGEVRVLGTDPQGAGLEWRNRVGIVLQSTGGLDLLTPREALASTAKAYSRPRDVDDVLASVGLEDKADSRIVGLSGGQRRRLDVALGIVGRPELLFLDEPTTGFDPQARRDFWGLIRSLAAEGTTILLTTHYLDEAETLADRVGVIAAGRLLAVDTPGRRSVAAAPRRRRSRGRRTASGAASRRRRRRPTCVQLASRMPGGEVPALTVTRPSLEDTYLALIAPHVKHPDDDVRATTGVPA